MPSHGFAGMEVSKVNLENQEFGGNWVQERSLHYNVFFLCFLIIFVIFARLFPHFLARL